MTQVIHAMRPLGTTQRAELIMWLRKNVATLQRDRAAVSEAAHLATKHLGTRIGGGNIEDALAAIGITLSPPVPIPVRFDHIPLVHSEPPHKETQMPPPPTPPPIPPRTLNPDPSDELVKMASDFAMLKNRIIEQSAAVSDALKFVKDAEAVHKAELDKLNVLTKEQLRLRTTIKEAMEI